MKTMLKNKKILVTGGAGFIGSHLCQALSEHNEVTSLDNYSTGTEGNHVLGVEYHNANTKDIEKVFEGTNYKPDIIYHLGEYSRVEQSFDDIERVWDSNKNGTFAVLEYVRKTGAKLIYSGSSTKFADDGIGKDQSPYAWTKSTNTELVNNYSNWFGINFAITYFYNVYGDREISTGKYATLIGLFKEKTLANEKLTVVLPGTQHRNFTHIKDIISGLVIVGENGEGDGYGIGSDQSYSIIQVAEMFARDYGMIEYLPERAGNRMGGTVMSDKTKALGWSEQHNLYGYVNELFTNNI